MLEHLAAGLAGSAFVQALQEQVWAVALIQALHIVAIGLLLFPAAHATLALAGGRGEGAFPVGQALRWTWLAVALLVVTGVLTVLSDPERTLLNSLFQAKMVLLVVALAASWWIERRLEAAEHGSAPPRLVAALWLVLWLAIILCGRLIAYFGAPPAA
ncbi:hypothetical protein H7F51_00685 [Novosphingobium flavum]|uniref:Uncharacterized protein n=1 Tax=Novosphingobium flavum TaxID=1778672 RepID=A0A7X1FNE6_9SPHN|nr:hypothetical protein [Novosphingobium flavum]MBC2664025.1 hypothetical protein [Novosphingobium flavum]